MAYTKDLNKPVEKSVERLKEELTTMTTKVVELLNGNGAVLENIPANKLSGEMPLELLPLRNSSGLCILNGELCLEASHIKQLSEHGQTIADGDVLLVYDVSRSEMRKISLDELYKQFLNLRVPHAAGQAGQLQLKGGADFTSTSNMSYDFATNKLKVDSNLEAQQVTITGALKTNIVKVQNDYTVEAEDYTILVENGKDDIVVTLPRPSNHEGRLLNIKKIKTAKKVIVKNAAGKIDTKEQIVLSTKNSGVCLQCDATDWWTINSL
jgi:hypothetical protein